MNTTTRWARWRAKLPEKEALLAIATFIVLIVTVIGVANTTQPMDRRLSLDGTNPNGLKALQLWLTALGYRVERNDGPDYTIPSDAKLLFVYPGERSFSQADTRILTNWVESGGTAVVLVPAQTAEPTLRTALGVRQRNARPQVRRPTSISESPWESLEPVQPWLQRPAAGFGTLDVRPVLDLGTTPAIPLIAVAGTEVTLAVQQRGNGRIWFLSPYHALTNEQLYSGGDSAVVLAILRELPAGALVIMDSYHLNGAGEAKRPPTLQEWLSTTPVGWAVLFVAGTLGLYLVTQGWRLGPALVIASDRPRREAAEFISAMASLQRRAGHHRAVAAHQRRRLKVTLGRRHGVDTDLADGAFVAALGRNGWSAERQDRLAALLAELARPVREEHLVANAAAVTRLLEEQ